MPTPEEQRQVVFGSTHNLANALRGAAEADPGAAAWLAEREQFLRRTGEKVVPELVEQALRMVSRDVAQMTIAELLALNGRTLAELRRREVVRTANAPAGDYAEWLVRHATHGRLAAPVQKSWDVLTPAGTRLQVKARVVRDPDNRSQRQVSALRSEGWERDFDFAVFVLFDEHYLVRSAAIVDVAAVKAVAKYQNWVHGWIVFATDTLLSQGDDWTTKLQDAAAAT